MSFRSRLALSLLLGLFLPAFLPLLHAQTGVTDLRTEYLPQPLAVETTTPRFRWRMTTVADRQNAHQTAYQITVTDEAGEPVWDSGKVTAETALNIPYAGTPLQPRTRYDWSVTLWAEDGSTATGASRFETALTLDGYSQTQWNDAQWIGGGAEDLVLYSPYLSVFRIDYTLTLAPDSDRAAFLFGGNDPRLLDKNKNLLAVKNARDESYLALVLDVTGLDEGQPAQLQVYRVGYAPTDRADRPLRSYPIPDSLINTGNRYAAHRFTLELVFGQGNIYLDGSGPEHRLNPEPMNLNPTATGAILSPPRWWPTSATSWKPVRQPAFLRLPSAITASQVTYWLPCPTPSLSPNPTVNSGLPTPAAMPPRCCAPSLPPQTDPSPGHASTLPPAASTKCT